MDYLTKEEVLKIFEIFIEFVDETCNDNTLKKYKGRLEEVLKEFSDKRKERELQMERDLIELEKKMERDRVEMAEFCRKR